MFTGHCQQPRTVPDSRVYLASDDVIDWQHPAILGKAADLSRGCTTDVAVARRCYEFVRDQIRHSWDYQLNPVTCRASDVLRHATGYCYAKSHLLAALHRACGIPAGLCYQRLLLDERTRRFSLHGLNAVQLKDHGWYRIDARGNKSGVGADFCPPEEKLAFHPSSPGEADCHDILAVPLPAVVKALSESRTIDEAYLKLPDLAVGVSSDLLGLGETAGQAMPSDASVLGSSA